jgi:hypothetical protein
MRNGKRHTVAVSFGGMVGGLLGTAALEKAIKLSEKLPEPLHMPATKGDPAEAIVKRAEELRGGPLPPRAHARAVEITHWLYGAAGAGVLAAMARRLKMHRPGNAVLAGAVMGAAVWAAGYLGWMPATGFTRRVTEERASKTAMSLVGHVLYGIVSAIPLYAAERVTRKRARVLGVF